MRNDFKFKIGIILVGILAVLVAVANPITAQDRYSTDRAAAIVNEGGGVLFGEPSKYRVLFDEFDVFNTALWDTTSNSGGVVTASADSAISFYNGGPAIMVTKSEAQAVGHVRWKGQGFRFDGTRRAEFETRVAIRDTTGSSFIIGMTTLTDSLAGAGRAPTAGAYFLKKAGASKLYACVFTAGGVADTTDTGVFFTRMTYRTLKITWNSNRLQFWVNGAVKVSQAASETPSSTIFPVFSLRTNTASVQKLYIDYAKVKQQRL